jgi:3-oxoacyl-[acyl-carrier protein] reductase
MSELAGRRIVLTGASRGFGRVLAHAFWAAGADLLLVARSADALETLAAGLAPSGQQEVGVRALDITQADAPQRIFSGTWERVDVLVNNAAVQGPIGKLWETAPEAWRETIGVDLLAPVALCHRAVPLMMARGGGVIINLSGGGAAAARPGFSAYAAAKTALVRVSECLAAELAHENITITAVAPGAMPTSMLDTVVAAGHRAGAAERAAADRARAEGGGAMAAAVALCLHLAGRPRPAFNGRLIAARWDDWRALDGQAEAMADSDIYTLRRIVPVGAG